MKKKIAVAVVSVSVLLTACTDETPKNDIKSDITTIEKAMPTVYKGLHIDMESYLVEGTLTVKTTLTNQSDQAIPLHYNQNRFATISLATEEEIVQETTLPFNEQLLASKEQVAFETTYVLPNIDKNYVIQANLHLEAPPDWLYTEKELSAVEVVRKEKKQELVFLPREPITYVYANKRNEALSQQEETYVHIEDGFVQSVDTERGTKIYYVDQKGLYVAYRTDTVTKDNLIGQVDYTKQLLLGFPIKLGTNWEVDGVNYEITALDQVLKTPIGNFTDVVEVTSDFGTGVKYLYQKDIGLLEVRVKNGDKWEVTSQLVERK